MSRIPSCKLQLLCAAACLAVLVISCSVFAAVDPAAVVMVQDAPNAKGEMNTGAGTVVAISSASTPVATILTCAHVSETGQPLTVDFRQRGFRIKATTLTIDRAKDYAILECYVPQGWTAKIPISMEFPKQGERVELYGYPWTAQGQLVRKSLRFDGFCADGFHPNWLSLEPGSISGDSGGPIIYKDAVIGVLSGAALHPQTKQDLNSHGPWVGLIDKKFMQCCGQPNGGFIGVGVGRVRIPQPPQVQYQPPAQATAARDPEVIAWMERINERLGQIKSCECSEQASPTAAEVAAELQHTMPTAEHIADKLFEKYGDKLKGDRGEQGPPGADGNNGASADDQGVSHATLVVDQNATYWPRLSAQLARAKERFSPIRIAPPPKFATELPAIVFYRKNGTSFIVRKGEREVTHTLTAIERGDLSFLQES